MRLLLIIAGVFSFLGFLHQILFFWASSQAINNFNHEFVKGGMTVSVYEADFLNLKEKFSNLKEVQLAVWLDIFADSKGQIRILEVDETNSNHHKKGQIWNPVKTGSSAHAQEKIEDAAALDGKLLKTWLSQNQNTKAVLNILSNTEGIDLQISDVLEGANPSLYMIQSPYDVIIKSIRKLRPQLIYGSSSSDEFKWLFFDSMRLLPLTPFNGDVLVISENRLKPEIAKEIERRKKYVLVGPWARQTDFKLLQDSAVRGVLLSEISNISNLIEAMRSKK